MELFFVDWFEYDQENLIDLVCVHGPFVDLLTLVLLGLFCVFK